MFHLLQLSSKNIYIIIRITVVCRKKEKKRFIHLISVAVGKINEIIANGIAKQGQRMGRFSPTRGPNFGPRMTQPPQPLMATQVRMFFPKIAIQIYFV